MDVVVFKLLGTLRMYKLNSFSHKSPHDPILLRPQRVVEADSHLAVHSACPPVQLSWHHQQQKIPTPFCAAHLLSLSTSSFLIIPHYSSSSLFSSSASSWSTTTTTTSISIIIIIIIIIIIMLVIITSPLVASTCPHSLINRFKHHFVCKHSPQSIDGNQTNAGISANSTEESVFVPPMTTVSGHDMTFQLSWKPLLACVMTAWSLSPSGWGTLFAFWTILRRDFSSGSRNK